VQPKVVAILCDRLGACDFTYTLTVSQSTVKKNINMIIVLAIFTIFHVR